MPEWEAALRRLPQQILASVPIEGPARAGLEKAALLHEDVVAGWFFEAGAAAWATALGRVRDLGLFPGDVKADHLAAVESLWAKSPQRAARRIDTILEPSPLSYPTLSLYRVPLAVFVERDTARARRLLDDALPRLSADALAILGPLPPLTYALCHAIEGNVARAAQALEVRPESSWRGLDHPEVAYQRGRYLWADDGDAAATEIARAIRGDAAYLLRLAVDPFLTGGRRQALLRDLVREAAEVVSASSAAPKAVRLSAAEILAGGRDGYRLRFAANVLASDSAGHGAGRSRAGLRGDLVLLKSFAERLPEGAPVRLGAGFAARFAGAENSDMARLERLVRDGELDEAELLARQCIEELPYAVQIACISHVTRLVEALSASAAMLERRNHSGDKLLLDKILDLYKNRCLELVEPVRRLTGTVGSELSSQLEVIWGKIDRIEAEWAGVAREAFGELGLNGDGDQPRIEVGGFGALRVQVSDAGGSPVAGVPVVWRVRSGPAVPKERSEGLSEEWALSLQTGLAYLTITGAEPGAGEVEARILGSSRVECIPYEITAPPTVSQP